MKQTYSDKEVIGVIGSVVMGIVSGQSWTKINFGLTGDVQIFWTVVIAGVFGTIAWIALKTNTQVTPTANVVVAGTNIKKLIDDKIGANVKGLLAIVTGTESNDLKVAELALQLKMLATASADVVGTIDTLLGTNGAAKVIKDISKEVDNAAKGAQVAAEVGGAIGGIIPGAIGQTIKKACDAVGKIAEGVDAAIPDEPEIPSP